MAGAVAIESGGVVLILCEQGGFQHYTSNQLQFGDLES